MSITLAIKTLFSISHSNEWLITRFAQSGDKKLFEQLYDNCGNDLYHFLVTQSDAHLAKDISQRTWLKVFEKPHLYKESGRFSAWLFTVARNMLVDEFRHTNRWEHLPEKPLNQLKTAFEFSDPIETIFDKTLISLPFEQRESFCLQQEGFGLQEIADITGCGVETVKSRIRYAKNSLRTQLEKYHD
ncbi:sigma-70 family RNA polymerase sigma factor [Aliiglaciecola sp. 3_MG-2023]|uniref:RNA polymerase sigma factor n=1 Tax=Aliiglaciecola sp. 3_MG-2023 TaxID=3062644 RepID=UPI0026E47F93|nr:sigma-70 family RNA polymerase sigma factor [Aliiglaciecola sp. 3_MG-2023]MDO6694841.1 sigma-70 family RNA polymerase sigma factor [Aliiglaciecola sp. 3_MG-2023]